MKALHRRGALRLSMQIRVCALPECKDDPRFVGPDGDPTRSFIDPETAPPAEVRFELQRRYFQYKVHFESDLDGEAPALAAVIVNDG